MRVNQAVGSQIGQRPRDAERLHAPALLAGGEIERGSFARQQRGFDSGRGQSPYEAHYLPLAAAHLFSGIEVENAH